MKHLIFLISFIYPFASLGQTAAQHLEMGKLKQEKKDYAGAMKEYERAIAKDSSSFEAYYCLATLRLANEKTKEAILDLNKCIRLKPEFTRALLLRGESHIKTNNKAKACEDFIRAKQLGDTTASGYVQQYFCEYQPKKGENIVLEFPESENWKITFRSSDNNQNIFLLCHSNETLKNWTELAGMSATIGMKNVDLNFAMNNFFEIAQDKSPQAKLTFIESDFNAKYPWIIYLIENVSNEDCICQEAQCWFLIQGEQSFYSCFRSVRGETFTQEQKKKFTEFFKKSEIVNE